MYFITRHGIDYVSKQYVLILFLITSMPVAIAVYRWREGYEVPDSAFYIISYVFFLAGVYVVLCHYVTIPLSRAFTAWSWRNVDTTVEAAGEIKEYVKPALPNLFFLFSVARSGVKGGLLSFLRYSSANEQRGFEEEVEGDAEHELREDVRRGGGGGQEEDQEDDLRAAAGDGRRVEYAKGK